MNVTAQAGDTLLHLRDGAQAIAESKASLRRRLRQQRKEIPSSVRLKHSQTVARRLLRSGLLLGVKRVAIYLSFASELGTAPLLAALEKSGLQVFTPAILKGRLRFRRNRPGLRMRHGHGHGMQQARAGRSHAAQRMDLIVLPLLGFDARGMRLGQGGGYYDRALRRCRRPYRLGLAYAAQQVDRIPAASWDQPLHAVLTECRLYRFHRH